MKLDIAGRLTESDSTPDMSDDVYGPDSEPATVREPRFITETHPDTNTLYNTGGF